MHCQCATLGVGRSVPTVQIGGTTADDKSDDGKTILSTK
jgi:hypothetical protein